MENFAMRKIVAVLGVLLVGCAFVTCTAQAQQTPVGPRAATAPDSPDALKAAAGALQTASPGGEVYVGGQGGYYVGAHSRVIMLDYANPPKGYANSLTYTGGNASWYVLQLDGFNFWLSIPTPASGGHEVLYWTGTAWAHWDTVRNAANVGNGN
jgi:hypothetical protein